MSLKFEVNLPLVVVGDHGDDVKIVLDGKDILRQIREITIHAGVDVVTTVTIVYMAEVKAEGEAEVIETQREEVESEQ